MYSILRRWYKALKLSTKRVRMGVNGHSENSLAMKGTRFGPSNIGPIVKGFSSNFHTFMYTEIMDQSTNIDTKPMFDA